MAWEGFNMTVLWMRSERTARYGRLYDDPHFALFPPTETEYLRNITTYEPTPPRCSRVTWLFRRSATRKYCEMQPYSS